MIQKLLQFHWFREPLPAWGAANLAEWRAAYPDWEVRLVAAPPEDLPERYRAVLERCPTPRLKADLERYWLMHRDGGVYADLDTRPLRKIEGLLNARLFIGCSRLPESDSRLGFVDQALLGSEPGHEFWLECLEGCLGAETGFWAANWFWLGNIKGEETLRADRRLLLLRPEATPVATPDETLAFLAGEREPLPVTGTAILKHYYHYSNPNIFSLLR